MKKIDAVVYTSATGSSEKYAKMIAKKLSVPCFELGKETLQKKANIIYIGWLMASSVKGYKKANKKYNIEALVAVGMGDNGSQIKEIKSRNHTADIPVFMVQGDFHLNKLKGISKFMISIASKGAAKDLKDGKPMNEEQRNAAEMMVNGLDGVCEENLKDLYELIK